MSRDEIVELIERVGTELPDVEYIVFSGGEVTLLKEDLFTAIATATGMGLGTRVVSNGQWGRSDEAAKWWVDKFITAGLNELNLSTGDEHRMFVPLENVLRAAYQATSSGLLTLVTVEGKDTSELRANDVAKHPLVRRILESNELRQRFVLMTNIWMPFHTDSEVTNNLVNKPSKGCDNIFTNFVVNPHGYLMSCCGLTMEYIPEHKVGNISTDRLDVSYSDQYRDLLKLWIWLDGTQFIFDQVQARTRKDDPLVSPHPCSICAQLYKSPEMRPAINDLVAENAESIVFRAALKARALNLTPNDHRFVRSEDANAGR